MSKVECTAVNDLIDLVKQKPLDNDANDDLFGPRAARLRGTPAPSLFEMPAVAPVALPDSPVAHRPSPHQAYPQQRATARRERSQPSALRRYALPLVGLVGLGLASNLVYTHFAAPAAAPGRSPAEIALAAAAAVPPLPRPAPAPPPAPAAAPKLVEVHLETTPPGATATLLENGTSTPLGVTPVDTSVDAAKTYDVVFALDGQPSKVEHFDPGTTTRVAVAFDAPATAAAAPATVSKTAKRRGHHAAATQAARVAVAAPAHHTAKDPAPVRDPAVATGPAAKDAGVGNGMLAVTTTPPCAILIDDRNTGLMSPQRAIPVPAGHHNVRLIAATLHINKLIRVDVTASKTTRINQTLSP